MENAILLLADKGKTVIVVNFEDYSKKTGNIPNG
jgi:hypothetical protein